MTKSLAKRVRSARKAIGLSQSALDTRAGLCHGHTWAIEKGIRSQIRTDTIIALSRALNVSASWLLTGSDPKLAEAS